MTKQRIDHKVLRRSGTCPHDNRPCQRARNCNWSKADSCEKFNTSKVAECKLSRCREKYGACAWQCSRDKERVIQK